MANISDRLKKAASTPKKSSSQEVLPGQDVLVDKVIKMKNAIDDMQRQYEILEGELTDQTYGVYSSARSEGHYSTTVFAPGKETNGAMVVYSDKFSNLPSEMEIELRKNDPNYQKHFVEVRKITVKRDAGKTITDHTIEKILNALGDDFEKIFEVKIEIGTQKGLAQMWDEVPSNVQDLLKQAKASVRNVTADGKVI
jgi:hypothetical protein